MHLSLGWLPLFAVALALPALGCARGEATKNAVPVEGVEGPDASLSFETGGTLTLAPGDIHAVTVVSSPPASYRMTFVLLGDALSASLDATTVIADDDGRATVNLRAPDSAATFRLRASIEGGPSVELPIAVSNAGFGEVDIVPVYSGKRPVTQWTASVIAGTTCASIAQMLPNEPAGALVVTAPAGEQPSVTNAPVGTNLAIALRAGHYMWGCADSTNLVAASSISVKVQVLDKPIVTSNTDLDVDLAYAPDPSQYGVLLGDAKQLLLDAFFPSSASDAKTLLDAMAVAVPASASTEFSSRRPSLGWDALVAASFQQKSVSLRDEVSGFIDAGLKLEPAQLSGHLMSAGATPGHALLSVKALGSVGAAAAGIPDSRPVSWTANPNDKLMLGGTLPWVPSRYLGSVAANGAAATMPASTSVAAELASSAQCNALGSALGDIAGCDATCLANACAAAIAARWELGLRASTTAGILGEIAITASGAATVDDTAAPQGFTGSWLGAVSAGTTSASVQGSATADVPQPF